MVLDALNAGLFDLSPEQATQLLSKWGVGWSHDKERDSSEKLVVALLDRGASPWHTDKMVDRWIDEGLVSLAARALAMRDAEEFTNAQCARWWDGALSRKSPQMVSLLLAQKIRAPRDIRGNEPLHRAADSRSAMHLLASGADPSSSNAAGRFPIEEWKTPWEDDLEQYKSKARSLRDFCVACMDTPRGLFQPGMEAAPLILAGLGDVRSALAFSGLTRSGMEVVNCRGFDQGASPLSGWCWSVFSRGEHRPSARASRQLLERSFDARDGTYDHEWVFAAAAVDLMDSPRPGAVESLAAPVRARMQELVQLPALDGSGRNRWQVAVRSLVANMGNPRKDANSKLSRKTLEHIFSAMASGCDMVVPLGDKEDLNALAFTGAQLMSFIAASKWSRGIPLAFWRQQGGICPEWMQKIDQSAMIAYVAKCSAGQAELPANIMPTPSWPPQALSQLHALQLNAQTPTPPRSTPSRRM